MFDQPLLFADPLKDEEQQIEVAHDVLGQLNLFDPDHLSQGKRSKHADKILGSTLVGYFYAGN